MDWSAGAQTLNYITAKNRVVPVGEVLSKFIDFLYVSDAIIFDELTLVGFSLGGLFHFLFKLLYFIKFFKAHVAGIAGKNVRNGRIDTIIGLDPAGPLFYLRSPSGRLDSNDAEYVEIIHTNGRVTGFGLPIGHSDFFPNRGMTQPGCITSFCSHDRAPLFFIESLNSNKFYARRCESASDIGRQCSGTLVTMGGEPSNGRKNVRGIFYLTTNRFSPFAQGRPTANDSP